MTKRYNPVLRGGPPTISEKTHPDLSNTEREVLFKKLHKAWLKKLRRQLRVKGLG